jgi:hypothetical protein
MKRVGTNIIRIMSYPNDGFDEGEWKKQVIHRLSILAAKAEQEGVILGHENCVGWGAQSPEHLRILLEEVNSPALQVIFDSGNPIAHGGLTEECLGVLSGRYNPGFVIFILKMVIAMRKMRWFIVIR